MAYKFQSWQVYKDARLLRQDIKKLANKLDPNERFVLGDQIRRAVLSVILQIAEGSNRKTEKDKNLFMNRALTSLDEVVACLDCILDDGSINTEEYNILIIKIENVSKQLRGLEKYIRKSY